MIAFLIKQENLVAPSVRWYFSQVSLPDSPFRKLYFVHKSRPQHTITIMCGSAYRLFVYGRWLSFLIIYNPTLPLVKKVRCLSVIGLHDNTRKNCQVVLECWNDAFDKTIQRIGKYFSCFGIWRIRNWNVWLLYSLPTTWQLVSEILWLVNGLCGISDVWSMCWLVQVSYAEI